MTTIREAALAAATLKALSDLVKSKDGEVRAMTMDMLRESYDDMGIKSLDVKLPDGTKIASISLSIPKPKGAVVFNDREFFDHVSETHPTAVYQPPTPEPVVSPAWATGYLAGLVESDGQAVDPETGEVVPGVCFEGAPAPKSFSVRFTDDGRGQVLDAWRAGQLAGLDDALALPSGD